ncbi:MAG: small multi-drug export protein [Spirochaetales bacterium]|nr:small multi-drug export protein [Spirochaetales bacterium]
MEPRILITTALLTLAPISELRGAIPYALAQGFPVVFTYLFCVLLNASLGPLVYLFLETLHTLFYRMGWYRRIFDALVLRARTKVHDKVERFGYVGIMLFVAVPLPITGAYTGVLGAWILGLKRKQVCLAVLGGVIISGVIVTLISYFGIQALSIFIKE